MIAITRNQQTQLFDDDEFNKYAFSIGKIFTKEKLNPKRYGETKVLDNWI